MSINRYFCKVESSCLVIFLRLLGRIGVKFDISDQCCDYYSFNIYANKKQLAELKKMLDIMSIRY